MSVVTKNEFWKYLTNLRRDLFKAIPKTQYATVIELRNGEPVLQFIGEATPSQKTYTRLKSYIPATGDRVMLINNVIQGGWKP